MQLVSFERRFEDASVEAGGVDHSLSASDPNLGFEPVEAGRPGARRLGAILREGPTAGDVVDLNRAMAMKLAFDDVGAPEAEADSLLPTDALGFLRRGEEALQSAHTAMSFVTEVLERYDPPDLVRAGVLEPRARVRLCAPVPRPGKVIGVARNYPEHASERGHASTPEEPTLFIKASSCVIGSGVDIMLPLAASQVDYEGELAVVIGRAAKRVPEADALSVVAGYTVANDVTARDFQHTGDQFFIGKSCDGFLPLGPVLVTADEVPDVQDLALQTTLSGEVVQSARTKEMTFTVARIIAFATRLMTLEPGDVILTGTPAGVGAAREPKRFLDEGDVVEVSIERIGTLRNHVTREIK